MKLHPVANIFPTMSDGEYAALMADIRANGQREAIWTWHGQIIDGKHRERACSELGRSVAAREWDGNENGLVPFVVSLNLHRRHLNESQRAVVAARISNLPAHRPSDKSADSRTSQPQAAALLNISERSIQDVKRLEREAPELLPQVESGVITLNAAIGEIKKRERIEDVGRQKNELAKARPGAPKGLFNVIAMDPPWPYDDDASAETYDPAGRRASNPYPEISLKDLARLELPAASDCVLWLWTTHKFMRHVFPLLDTWGFEDKAIVTWVKDRMGLGRWLRSQSEFCIMAVKGNPVLTLTNQTTIIQGPMRQHSRKPDEFYAMVDSLCHGRKLDYYSREPRDGWEQYGDEIGKFAT